MSSSPKISSFSVIVAFICVALAGLAFLPLLPVKLSPSRNLPKLTVSYSMTGNSARVIEMEVTSSLEAMLARIKGIREIRSKSGNGWGAITLEFDKHTNIDAARFEASTIVRQIWPELPEEVSYPVIEMSRPDEKDSRPFISYTLNAPASPVYIQQYAEEHIKTRLAGIPGIYRVDVSGATPMEWQLEYDSQQLDVLGITVQDIRQAISSHYSREFLGLVTTGQQQEDKKEWIRLVLLSEEKGELFDPMQITVANKEHKLIRLDQLLKVRRLEQVPQNYYRINGLNSIYLSIRAEDTANQLQVAAAITKDMEEIRQQLPAGYELHVSYDATQYIREELEKIYFRSILTVIILLLFVLLITRSMRYLFLILISLIINLAIAIILYYLLKLEMQLYSLAGITISLSLVIDNTIVMIEHIRIRHNRNAFLPILTATLTTAGALTIIFFLDEKIRINLQDFAAVVIINLVVSLFIALFLVPALIDKIGLYNRKKREGKTRKSSTKRLTVYFTRFYEKQISLLTNWRKTACVVLILIFGLPVFMLPDKIETEDKELSKTGLYLANKYNQLLKNETYKEKIKPLIDKALGGTLRLFVQKVYEGSYFTDNEELVLMVSASLPNGSTITQMNDLIAKMEAYLTSFSEIRQFHTEIYNPQQAMISVYFTKESGKSGFPYTLKSRIISKALGLGGGSWNVFGLRDQGFSNDVRENAGSFRIEMYGYNYDELYNWAETLKEKLLSYRRIQEVTINSEFSWWKPDYQEYYFDFNKSRMAEENIVTADLFRSISQIFGNDILAGQINTGRGTEKLKLLSRQSKELDIWNMQYTPQYINATPYKLSELASIEKGSLPQQIIKVNQQYRLCLQYEYIGAVNQGNKILEKELKEFNALLPMGYTAEGTRSYWEWDKKDKKQYLLLLLIIVIIFFTTSILFNSFKQPLAVIFVIPIAYIGVFLTFYWFKLNFDQGGFASFVLLCGITVNASIYILNEYNQLRIQKPLLSPSRAYLKAWNSKIIPIFLTVISTILGFIPFMLGSQKEGFWFPLAAGTIGGLIVSLAGIYLYLPVFLLHKDRRLKQSSDR